MNDERGGYMSATKTEATEAIQKIKGFMPASQLSVISDLFRGEEKQFFFDKMVEMASLIETMPKTYEQDGLGEDAIVHLHYFRGGVDAWVTEKDMGDPSTGDTSQTQAFGLITLTGSKDDAEFGYINIEELVANGVELDLYWSPKKLKEVR
jgi:hypothetical protein